MSEAENIKAIIDQLNEVPNGSITVPAIQAQIVNTIGIDFKHIADKRTTGYLLGAIIALARVVEDQGKVIKELQFNA